MRGKITCWLRATSTFGRRNFESARCRFTLVVTRNVTRYTQAVIVSFRHKGLEQLYRDGSKRGVQSSHVPKLLRILSALDVAATAADLALPSFRTHELKGDMANYWSIWVNGNWRITFRFTGADIELVDYQDYH